MASEHRAVAGNGIVVEAMLDVHDDEFASYHGYPLLSDDPLEEQVRVRWHP
jgi:hypothetical protein